VRLAVDHLAELGHREIVHVDGARGPGAADRRNGYRTAMRRRGLTQRIVPGGPSEEDGAAAARGLADVPPTAVLTYNDRCAVGCSMCSSGRESPFRTTSRWSLRRQPGGAAALLTADHRQPGRRPPGHARRHRAVARLEGEPVADARSCSAPPGSSRHDGAAQIGSPGGRTHRAARRRAGQRVHARRRRQRPADLDLGAGRLRRVGQLVGRDDPRRRRGRSSRTCAVAWPPPARPSPTSSS